MPGEGVTVVPIEIFESVDTALVGHQLVDDRTISLAARLLFERGGFDTEVDQDLSIALCLGINESVINKGKHIKDFSDIDTDRLLSKFDEALEKMRKGQISPENLTPQDFAI